MPEGMSGLELAEKLRDERPALNVLFTSGYSTEFFSLSRQTLRVNGVSR